MMNLKRHIPAIFFCFLGIITLNGCVAEYPGYADGYGDDVYWRDNYINEPYYLDGYGYEVYRPAYHYGFVQYNRYKGRHFQDLNDSQLRADWERGRNRLDWEHARGAVRAEYEHMGQHNTGFHSGGMIRGSGSFHHGNAPRY